MNELELRVGVRDECSSKKELELRVGVPSAGGDGQRAKRELSTGQKLLTRKAKGKENLPPCTPYKRKAKGKETRPGLYFSSLTTPRARVHAWDEACAAANHIVQNCFGTPRDRDIWAACIYYHPGSANDFVDKAFEYASKHKQEGDPENPITAFQAWINENFPKTTTTKEL